MEFKIRNLRESEIGFWLREKGENIALYCDNLKGTTYIICEISKNGMLLKGGMDDGTAPFETQLCHIKVINEEY